MKSKTSRTSKNTSSTVVHQSEQVERVKRDLLSLVSHELKTPLTSVLNALRIIREEELSDSDRLNFLEMAYRNADTLNFKLGQLLDLSNLMTGRLVCRFHEMSLKNLLITQLERFVVDAEDLGFNIEIDSTSKMKSGKVIPHISSLPIILGDALRLEQAIWALFDNSLKFSPQGSKVFLKVRSGVKFKDLPAHLQEHVFMPRNGATTTTEYVLLQLTNPVGTTDGKNEIFGVLSHHEGILAREHEGVGGSLAIAAEVLHQHGGAMDAERAEADGAFTVWVAIPVLHDEVAVQKVLESRMLALKAGVGGLALIVVTPKEGSLTQLREALKEAVFRASDAVYELPDAKQVAVIVDDCKPEDVPKIIRRLAKNVKGEASRWLEQATVGIANFPEDATAPEALIEHARTATTTVEDL